MHSNSDRVAVELWIKNHDTSASGLAVSLGWAKSTMTRWLNRESELTEEKSGRLAQRTGIPSSIFRRCRSERKEA